MFNTSSTHATTRDTTHRNLLFHRIRVRSFRPTYLHSNNTKKRVSSKYPVSTNPLGFFHFPHALFVAQMPVPERRFVRKGYQTHRNTLPHTVMVCPLPPLISLVNGAVAKWRAASRFPLRRPNCCRFLFPLVSERDCVCICSVYFSIQLRRRCWCTQVTTLSHTDRATIVYPSVYIWETQSDRHTHSASQLIHKMRYIQSDASETR